ncbi:MULTISPECIES: fimbrial protein [Serratia]|uniref:fimbrial protein n=1 Tax=Serratia TaxID=613 RepID=UPI0009B49282|nr:MULTISPECIES: fimbrial protein [Serratia]MDQ7098047.1 fimbrial protein [Serratia sp. MF2]MDQ7103152.1 fimbrial protein [Serratia sp. MF1(2023)]NSM13389.1 fimbrial protein [Serratia marcescens]NSM96036.1 fimbrial protein [Serratia marcescens]HEP0390135.1 fimbrial protein [Serratia marcescens]
MNPAIPLKTKKMMHKNPIEASCQANLCYLHHGMVNTSLAVERKKIMIGRKSLDKAKIILHGIISLALVFLYSAKTYAGDEDCRAMYHIPPYISQSPIVVPADASNGAVLGQGELDFSVKVLSNGEAIFGYGHFVVQPFTYLTSTGFKHNGIPVYKTSWEGIGIAMSLNNHAGIPEFSGPDPTPPYYILSANFKYYLVKIGDIKPGVMPQFEPFLMNYACLRIAGRAFRLGHPKFPATNVSVEGCRLTTPIKYVHLGEVNRKEFSGIGSTAGETPFDITLECNSDAKVDLEIRGQTVSGNNQVLAINHTDNAAKGVGLQILRNGAPFDLGNKINALDTTLLGQNSLSFLARFYQTEANITPGDVSAIAQFTVSYR